MWNILLFDDDPGLAAPLREHFSRLDINLVAEQHPLEGLRRLRQQGTDNATLDVMLPEMDGCEVCCIIRPDSQLPIIMSTARGEVTGQIETMRGPGYSFVGKRR